MEGYYRVALHSFEVIMLFGTALVIASGILSVSLFALWGANKFPSLVKAYRQREENAHIDDLKARLKEAQDTISCFDKEIEDREAVIKQLKAKALELGKTAEGYKELYQESERKLSQIASMKDCNEGRHTYGKWRDSSRYNNVQERICSVCNHREEKII